MRFRFNKRRSPSTDSLSLTMVSRKGVSARLGGIRRLVYEGVNRRKYEYVIKKICDWGVLGIGDLGREQELEKIKSKAENNGIGEKIKKSKNNKLEFKFVENLIYGEIKSGEFEQMLDEVAKIFYSHICQLTKIQINSGSFNNNLLTGASING